MIAKPSLLTRSAKAGALASLLLLMGGSLAALQAATIRPVYDALCAAPRLNLDLTTDDGTVGVLEGSESLEAADWRPLLQLGAVSGHHEWMDPAARSAARRFYRLRRAPRAPLLPVPNFRLIDHQGASQELFREGDARAVVLVFTDAATLESHWRQLKDIVASPAAAGLQFWMIDPVDDRRTMTDAAVRAGVAVPVLHDAAQLVARSYGAAVPGEALVLEAESLTPVYRGAIEDTLDSTSGQPVRQAYLAEALARFATGARPAVEYARPQATPWRLGDPGIASYRNEIAPLLQATKS